MRQRNIALIGFRATGKSTVGEILARKLGMEFVDMDQRLTSEAGRDIATWVTTGRVGFFQKIRIRPPCDHQRAKRTCGRHRRAELSSIPKAADCSVSTFSLSG